MNSGNLIVGMLGVLFVGLKLTGYIDWSWWIVTLPFWGGLAIAGIVLVSLMMFTLLFTKTKLSIIRKNK